MTTNSLIRWGGSAFLIGSLLLGLGTMRAGLLPRRAGLMLAVGAGVWLLAFFGSVFQSPIISIMLAAGSLLVAGSLAWLGWRLYAGRVNVALAQARSAS